MPIKSRNLPPNLISGADALKHPVMLAAEKRAREELRELQDTYVEECRRAAANDPHGNFEKAVKASDWPHPTREALLVGKLRDKSLPFLVRRDGEFVEGDPDKDLGTLAAILRVVIRLDQLYQAFGEPVPPTLGTDAVADAPAPAKRAPAKRAPNRTRTKRDPAKKAAVDLWPPDGRPPPELSRQEEHELLGDLLKERYPKRDFSPTTFDRVTGRRKDRPSQPK